MQDFIHPAMSLKDQKKLVFTAMSKHLFYYRMFILKHGLGQGGVPDKVRKRLHVLLCLFSLITSAIMHSAAGQPAHPIADNASFITRCLQQAQVGGLEDFSRVLCEVMSACNAQQSHSFSVGQEYIKNQLENPDIMPLRRTILTMLNESPHQWNSLQRALILEEAKKAQQRQALLVGKDFLADSRF